MSGVPENVIKGKTTEDEDFKTEETVEMSRK
jgi:hypothetical protein